MSRAEHHPAEGATLELARFIERLCPEDLGSDVEQVVTRHLADHIANVVRGSVSDVAVRPLSTITGSRVPVVGGAPVPAVGVGYTSRLETAWCNGISAHALDMDDGYTPGGIHPGSGVLPAVLAAATPRTRPADLRLACAVGLEVACRVAGAGHPLLRENGYHSTGTAGVFGAAAGVAKLWGLDAPAVASALGIAGSHSSGLMAFLDGGDDVKAIHAGRAARDGLQAAILARSGVSGPSNIFESRYGYFACLVGEAALADQMVTFDQWAVRNCYVKPYPGCRDAHAAVDAVLALRRLYDFAVSDIEQVVITTQNRVATHDRRDFATTLQAQLSIPYNVAVTLIDGCLTFDQFEPDRIVDREVRQLVDRCVLVGSAEFDAMFPSARPSRVEIITANRSLTFQVNHALGEPDNPLSDRDLVTKFEVMTAGVLEKSATRRLLRAVQDLDVETMATVLGCVQRETQP